MRTKDITTDGTEYAVNLHYGNRDLGDNYGLSRCVVLETGVERQTRTMAGYNGSANDGVLVREVEGRPIPAHSKRDGARYSPIERAVRPADVKGTWTDHVAAKDQKHAREAEQRRRAELRRNDIKEAVRSLNAALEAHADLSDVRVRADSYDRVEFNVPLDADAARRLASVLRGDDSDIVPAATGYPLAPGQEH